MKIFYYLLILLLQFTVAVNAQTILKPNKQTKTSFAIIIDSASYINTKDAVMDYKAVIENDNLGTYVIIDNWKSPDQIKTILLRLYNDKSSPLEGTVFVGDIPITMIRDAHHLTSAFKMDQDRYAWSRSSVTSDRFYDDFDLKFDFLKQDEAKSDYFYYSLRHDGEQKLNSDIYSARIKPYGNNEVDKYTQLNNYLKKVVKERSINKNNTLEKLSLGRGHGYNSESKVSWSAEQLTLKEQFPKVFSTQGRVKFMDFDSNWPIKNYLLEEVQQPELDVMLFHHHGGNDIQYLNGYKNGSDPTTSTENIKLYARSKIRSMAEKKGKEDAIKHYCEYLNIPRSWVENTFDQDIIDADSLMNLSLDININDIRNISPNARFVMFDACYNGSFYEEENIVGEYIFNDGKTIVTQGNTVNVIQDKWPDELLGLLAAGLRVGAWNQQINYLETHIIGDPTFRFANNTNIDFDLNHAIRLKAKDNKFWLKALENPNVDLQALALKMLYENNFKDISNLVKKTYLESPSMIVRTEAFFLTSKIDDENFIDILKIASHDSYELIRRFAIEFIGKNGSDELIPSFVHSILWDNTSARVDFKQNSILDLLNLEKISAEIKKQTLENPIYEQGNIENLLVSIDKRNKSFNSTIAELISSDTTVNVKDKKMTLRNFRNNPATKSIDQLLQFVNNTSVDEELRLIAVEALGWYNYSYRKSDIVKGLSTLASNTNKNEALRNETIKTINRLK